MTYIDLSYLEEITSGEKEVMCEMLDLFIRDIPAHVAAIVNFAASKNMEELGAEAHKLKPAFLYIGLTELSEDSKKLETIGRDGEFTTEVPGLVEKLKSETPGIVSQLQEARKRVS